LAEKLKKPFYKKWWFWVAVVIVVFAIGNTDAEEEEQIADNHTEQEENTASSSEEAKTESESEETEEVAANEEATEEVEEAEPQEEEQESEERDNSSAEETTLNAGTFEVGSDVPAGRYVITGDGNGNFFVYDGEMPVVNEILDPSGEFGVTSVTTDLEDGQEVEISGINAVTFTPAETSMSNTLSTGTWEVGLDIEAGRYDVTTPSGSGNFFVNGPSGFPAVNEILDASGEFGVTTLTVDLEDGQTIEIMGLNEVEFTAK